ncbi:Zinc finger protein 561 [Camponotus japonicus]
MSTSTKISANQAKSLFKEKVLFSCNICHNGYIQQADLYYHALIKPKQLNCCFRCDFNIFFNQRSFETHMLKRHNVKHVCMFCPEAFNGLMYRKKKHDKTHYQCIYCHKVFHTPKKLYNHLCLHSKPFTCSVCAKKFNTKGSLGLHLVNKHRERPCGWLPSFKNP